MSDVKFLRQENEKLKAKIREGQDSVSEHEVKLHSSDMKLQEIVFQVEEKERVNSELRALIKGKDDSLKEYQIAILNLEQQKIEELDSLKTKIKEMKEANQYLVGLYEGQIEALS